MNHFKLELYYTNSQFNNHSNEFVRWFSSYGN